MSLLITNHIIKKPHKMWLLLQLCKITSFFDKLKMISILKYSYVFCQTQNKANKALFGTFLCFSLTDSLFDLYLEKRSLGSKRPIQAHNT